MEAIAKGVKALSEEFEVVLSAGGIGPTVDDITIAGISRAFGLQVTRCAMGGACSRGGLGALAGLLTLRCPPSPTALRFAARLPELERRLKKYFGENATQGHLKMAEAPDSAPPAQPAAQLRTLQVTVRHLRRQFHQASRHKRHGPGVPTPGRSQAHFDRAACP